MADISVQEPFPISLIANRYLLFNVNAVTYARREHNICGILIGTIPHLSQQNIFLGIPLELMPEEARLLVEKGHAYVVEDVEAHKSGFLEMSREERLDFLEVMDKQGMETALSNRKKAEERSKKALQQKGLARKVQGKISQRVSETAELGARETSAEADMETSLFNLPSRTVSPAFSQNLTALEPYFITPTTSYPPLITPPTTLTLPLPDVPRT